MHECCGFRMGPFELLDLTGMDVNYPVSEIVHKGYWYDPRVKTTPLHESLFLAGRFGRKTGQGFHRYDRDGRKLGAAPSAAAQVAKPAGVIVPEAGEALVALAVAAGVETQAVDDKTSPILVAPSGEDCTAVVVRLGLDPRRTVAIDLAHDTAKRLTMMTAPAADPAIADAMAALLGAAGRAVTRIKDSAGFIAQRITAMIANIGCEMAQMASPAPRISTRRCGSASIIRWARWDLPRSSASSARLRSCAGCRRSPAPTATARASGCAAGRSWDCRRRPSRRGYRPSSHRSHSFHGPVSMWMWL
jgi:3-hydroxybutyryl-CoA dehydrogenase